MYLSWSVLIYLEKTCLENILFLQEAFVPNLEVICKNHLKSRDKETEKDKWRQMKSMYGMIMSLEIITVLARSNNRAPGTSRSVGRSPCLRDSEDLVVSALLVRQLHSSEV